MVSGHCRSGDVPAVDHTPPGSTRSAVTRVLQRLRPRSWRRTDSSGGRSQRWEGSASRYDDDDDDDLSQAQTTLAMSITRGRKRAENHHKYMKQPVRRQGKSQKKILRGSERSLKTAPSA